MSMNKTLDLKNILGQNSSGTGYRRKPILPMPKQ